MPCKKICEIRHQLIELFKQHEIDNPSADAGVIIMHVLGITKTQLIMGDMLVEKLAEDKIFSLAGRRCNGVPVQYLTGECEFMSLKFKVNKSVLIPRADTEILVEALIERFGNKKIRIADIGCGSGCIGISLLHYLNNATVAAVDISKGAIGTAKENALLNNVSERISFLECDIMQNIPDIVADCIVSNPPYIRSDVIPMLEKSVKEFEPYSALDGGIDGLDFYRRIAKYIKPVQNGILAFETGYDQGDAVAEILSQNSYTNIEIIKDIEGRQRVVLGYLQDNT